MGWYAICNAVAFNKRYAARQSIDSLAIAQEVQQNLIPHLEINRETVMKQSQLDSFLDGITLEHAYQLASYFNLSNCYILNVVPRQRWLQWYMPHLNSLFKQYVDTSKYTDVYTVGFAKAFFQTLAKHHSVFHLYISATSRFLEHGKHAILVTVMMPKDRHQKPMIYYFDSNNNLITDYDSWLLPGLLHIIFETLNDAFAENEA